MKIIRSAIALSVIGILFGLMTSSASEETKSTSPKMTKTSKNQLRHVVLFKFNEATPKKTVEKIEAAFNALPQSINEIVSYEWGLNNSTENLDKGFTHCYFLTFNTQEDLTKGYLPHPDHRAFVALVTPHVADVLVVDYWTQ